MGAVIGRLELTITAITVEGKFLSRMHRRTVMIFKDLLAAGCFLPRILQL